jgi:hypothetical protein
LNNFKITDLFPPFTIDKKGQEIVAVFSVSPSKEVGEISIKSIVTVDGLTYDLNKIDINYPHIYKQMVLKPAEAKAIRLEIKTKKTLLKKMFIK